MVGGATIAAKRLIKHLPCVDVLVPKGEQLTTKHTGLQQIQWLLGTIKRYPFYDITINYDVLHFWGAFPGVYLPKLGKPYIITCHGTDVHGKSEASDRVLKWAFGYKRMFTGASRVVAINNRLARLAHAFCLKDIDVIENGIETPRTIRKPINDKMIVTTSRLISSRNVSTIIRAMNHLPEHTLHIYGDGPLMQVLDNLIGYSGLRGRVLLLGWCKDIPAVLPNYSIFVQAAEASGPTLGLLEARSCGLACVSTIFPGHDKYTLSRAYGNTPRAIANAILKVNSNHFKIDDLPTWEDSARKYERLYCEVAS